MNKRNREWRRYMEYKKVKKRLQCISITSFVNWSVIDVNHNNIEDPLWHDYIGTKVAYLYKNITTDYYATKTKIKWGKTRNAYRYSYFDKNNRLNDKRVFKKELNELGLKHFPAKLGPKLDHKK